MRRETKDSGGRQRDGEGQKEKGRKKREQKVNKDIMYEEDREKGMTGRKRRRQRERV